MTSSDQDSNKARYASRVALALSTFVFSMLLILMGMMTIMSPMAFDSGENLTTWVLVGGVCSCIPLTLISIPASWISYRKRFYCTAIGISLLPLTSIIIVGTMFAFPSAFPFH